MSDFYKDLQRGKQAEIMVANAFENMHYRVTNVTMDQEY